MESLGQKAGGAQQLGLAAFGLSLLADVPLPGAWEAPTFREPGLPSLQIQSVTAQAIEHSWSGLQAIGWKGVIDGAPFVVERGVEGDHRFVHGTHPEESGTPSDGTRAVHHLCADASVLQCAPSDPAEPRPPAGFQTSLDRWVFWVGVGVRDVGRKGRKVVVAAKRRCA